MFGSQQASDRFFNDPSASTTRGVTTVSPDWINAYVRLAENSAYDGSGGNLSAGKLSENTIHELGHVIDFGVSVDSNSPEFDAYVQNDWANLDYYYNGTTYVARPPCTSVATYSIIPPFQDVANVCHPITGALNPIYAGMSNHQILRAVETNTFHTYNLPGYPQSWRELYPTAFAYEVYSWNNLDWFSVFANQVFANGYFPCVRTYLATVNSTGSRPISGGACSAAVGVPGWVPVH